MNSKAMSLNIGVSCNGAQRLMLPHSAYDDAIAILGRRGRGKTTSAADIIEELHSVGRRFCILDPTGVWHGLRSSVDGKQKGLPVVVMGGDHGDVPLEAGSGKVIAAFVADARNPSTVLDLSGFDDDEVERFANDFQRHLYKINRHRLHLVYDECQFIAPENPDSNTAHKMKKAAGKVFQLGRAHGLLPILISPRPSSVSKDCLYSCGMMIVHGITAPKDQDSLKQWVKNAGTPEQVAEFQPSLSKLPIGTAWVWSPDADIFQRVLMRKRTTFDSSKTAGGGSRSPKVRATVDLTALTGAIAATIERAKQDDPAALRQQITQLRGELSAAARVVEELKKRPESVKEVEVPALSKQDSQRLLHLAHHLENGMGVLPDLLKLVKERVPQPKDKQKPELYAWKPPAPLKKGDVIPGPGGGRIVGHSVKDGVPMLTVDTRDKGREIPGVEEISKSSLKVLDSVAWFYTLGNSTPVLSAIAFKAGYTVGTGRFNNLVSELKGRGLVVKAGEGLSITEAGKKAAAWPKANPTREDLHASVLSVLGGSEAKLMKLLLARGEGGSMHLGELASMSQYTLGTGRFNNLVSRLKSLGLAVKVGADNIGPAPCMFP